MGRIDEIRVRRADAYARRLNVGYGDVFALSEREDAEVHERKAATRAVGDSPFYGLGKLYIRINAIRCL
jgi:hypothetical protein